MLQDPYSSELLHWLNILSKREQCRFLTTHLALLDRDNDAILNTLLAQEKKYSQEAQHLRDALYVLQDARQRGGMREAIQETYINMYGGFVLDLPDWLVEVERQHDALSTLEQQHETAGARIKLLRNALEHAQRDTKVAPEVRATLQALLANALRNDTDKNRRARSLEDAIAQCERSMETYTVTRYPVQYAQLHHVLGIIYRNRSLGRRWDNIEQAIMHYEAELCIHTLETFPLDYTKTQNNLGRTYYIRVAGEQRSNMEAALHHFDEALHIFTEDAYPHHHAQVLNNMGYIYIERIEGERRENIEKAIDVHRQALTFHTEESKFRYDYASAQNNLGLAYFYRIDGTFSDNLEQAIIALQKALQVRTLEDFPPEYALSQNNLGLVYLKRIAGERRTNIERAIACFEEALRVRTYKNYPTDYAQTQQNLCVAYEQRLEGDRQANLRQAKHHYEKARRVYTRADFPNEYARALNDLSKVYKALLQRGQRHNREHAANLNREALQTLTLEAFPTDHRLVQLDLAEIVAELGDWAAAHEAYKKAQEAEELLLALGAGVLGRDAILREGHNTATRDGFALTRLGRLEEAAITIEQGRARDLAQAIAFDAADPSRIPEEAQRKRYIDARQGFITAQAVLHTPLPSTDEDENRRVQLQRTETYRTAKAAFDVIVAEIRQANDSTDFLNTTLDAPTILYATQYVGLKHALVYLAATPWGGMALAALNTSTHHPAYFAVLDLPILSDSEVDVLVEVSIEDRVVGGFDSAQQGTTYTLLDQWSGETFREKAITLHVACQKAGVASSLDEEVQCILLDTESECAALIDQPLSTLDEESLQALKNTLNRGVLDRELLRCQARLAEVAMEPLLNWLRAEGISSLTLIPCGVLAAFPLAGISLANGETVGETISTNIVPSVRVLLADKQNRPERHGIYTIGDPHPQESKLEWGEAEAFTLAAFGRKLGLPVTVKVQHSATRTVLLDALQSSYIVDACCHGTFDAYDILRSCLHLADTPLTLADMLSGEYNLHGLRLLILSACQTAILDLHGARDEVRSLATAMLQAGARAVLAALWAVDDEATYLLMVRFAQEWFQHMTQDTPAAALARAQHWLRTVTNRELLQWKQDLPAVETPLASPVKSRTRIAVRGRGYRFHMQKAEKAIKERAYEREDLDAQPYSAPYYWAGFQLNGW
jgi:CHAT domain-containing protein